MEMTTSQQQQQQEEQQQPRLKNVKRLGQIVSCFSLSPLSLPSSSATSASDNCIESVINILIGLPDTTLHLQPATRDLQLVAATGHYRRPRHAHHLLNKVRVSDSQIRTADSTEHLAPAPAK